MNRVNSTNMQRVGWTIFIFDKSDEQEVAVDARIVFFSEKEIHQTSSAIPCA